MEIIGHVAAVVLGLSLGLFFGRLLNAILIHWEKAASAVKAFLAVIAFLLGGGAGAAIFGVLSKPHGGAFYLLALGIGLSAAFFFAKVPPRYSLQTFSAVIKLSETLRDSIPDPDERAFFILSLFSPTKTIESDARIDRTDLAQRLERATDAIATRKAPDDAES